MRWDWCERRQKNLLVILIGRVVRAFDSNSQTTDKQGQQPDIFVIFTCPAFPLCSIFAAAQSAEIFTPNSLITRTCGGLLFVLEHETVQTHRRYTFSFVVLFFVCCFSFALNFPVSVPFLEGIFGSICIVSKFFSC